MGWLDPKEGWIAPDGKVWQCGACGKRAKHRAGYTDKDHRDTLPFDRGWDESCMLNAVLVDDAA